MRSRRISAKQACDWGIATECVSDSKLEAATDALGHPLAVTDELALHRNWRKAARSSSTNNSGCSNAAKCPPSSSSFQYAMS